VQLLVQAGVEPSVGSVGDSYDNALAETINGLYKGRDHPSARAMAVIRSRRVRDAWTGSTIGGSWSRIGRAFNLAQFIMDHAPLGPARASADVRPRFSYPCCSPHNAWYSLSSLEA
jgi:transposase InsO family protein